MHKSSYLGMQQHIDVYLSDLPADSIVLDIGAVDINGSYRPLFDGLGVRYVGVDLAPGRNVDLVMPEEYAIGLPENTAAAVISGQCLEHCRNPFRLVGEMHRVCKPGGYCIIVAPREWKEHRRPWDCWRFLADGMRALLEESGFEVIRAYVNAHDCWGIGRKRD